MNHALQDGPDLIELFGEGQMTRTEFLSELHRKIPESNAYPDALERDAWQRTAWAADPREVAQWAVELSKREDMDDLVNQTFALRNGSDNMLRNLKECDPFTVARLLATIPVEQRGPAVIEVMQENDRELGRLGLEIKEPSPAYRRGVAESLLKQGRVDEFLNAFTEVGDPKEMNELASQFGSALTSEKQGDEVLALLFRLPEEYRNQVADTLMGQWNSYAQEIPEVREARKRWIEKFAAQGFCRSRSDWRRPPLR